MSFAVIILSIIDVHPRISTHLDQGDLPYGSFTECLLAGGATMETTYLGIIALLDKAESLANNSDKVSATDALQIGHAKQQIIESFASANRTHTLQGMIDRIKVVA